MKVIKIGAIWCGGCLVMNKIWKALTSKYNFSYEELDYDMDEEEVKKYDVGKTLPVFIVLDNDKEVDRIVGEVSLKEFEEKLKEVGIINE